jgi:hypothetical protein
MHDLFTRLESTRKRVIVKRQLMLLERLLSIEGRIELNDLISVALGDYNTRKNPYNAMIRDLNRLYDLGAISIEKENRADASKRVNYYIHVKLDWPTTITETQFFEYLDHLPKAKTHRFLSSID